MKLVKYKLVDGQIPSFATEGGYFSNSEDDTLICVMADDAEHPDSTTLLTLDELIERQLAIHAKHRFIKAPEPAIGMFGADYDIPMTDDEVKTAVADWVAARE